MCMCHSIEAVDRTLKDLMRSKLAFAGKVKIFSGDFLQILPVVPRGCRARVATSCFSRSLVFPFL